jgi:aspartate carbamoyltransferase catalytic subunit
MDGVRHLVSIDDLSVPEIREILDTARRFEKDLKRSAGLCRGMISASLFYEASTRTRLSFESAMLRLGGGTLTAADMRTMSASKGESLADTVRVVGGAYADIIVLRHPSEGAARLASQYSPVPVINAGDGSHEHPTQTLCDLYSLWVEHGKFEGLDVVLAGDLRYSRTIHSFAFALARFSANIVCVPQPGFEMPEYVLDRLKQEFGVEPLRADATRLGDLASRSDAVYLTPQKPHQLSLFTDARGFSVDRVDAVYMTRPQTERHPQGNAVASDYFQLGKRALAAHPLKDAVVMHPLPRRDEISADIDDDPRSIYFKQAAYGVPIRMAILARLLGAAGPVTAERAPKSSANPVTVGPNPCSNPTCISRTEARHVVPLLEIASRAPLRAECGYCSQQIVFGAVGCSTTRRSHDPESPEVRKIRPDHVVLFRDFEEAKSHGFDPAERPAPTP